MKMVNLLVEDALQEAILSRLLEGYAHLPKGTVYGKRGRSYILERIDKYNQAARFYPWIILVDLDRDADCAPPYVGSLVPEPAKLMCLRVAVREVEAWLLADSEAMASFLGVNQSILPKEPDRIEDPKESLIKLARRSSQRLIRDSLAPRPGSGARIGPAYNIELAEFAARAWRPWAAASRSDSLRRCLAALGNLDLALA